MPHQLKRQTAQRVMEFLVGRTPKLGGLHCMTDGRGIATAEVMSDPPEAVVGQSHGEAHRDLARADMIAGSGPARLAHDAKRQPVMIGDGLLDGGDGQHACGPSCLRMVAKRLFA